MPDGGGGAGGVTVIRYPTSPSSALVSMAEAAHAQRAGPRSVCAALTPGPGTCWPRSTGRGWVDRYGS